MFNLNQIATLISSLFVMLKQISWSLCLKNKLVSSVKRIKFVTGEVLTNYGVSGCNIVYGMGDLKIQNGEGFAMLDFLLATFKPCSRKLNTEEK